MRIGVILAAGRGERMAAGRNKALLELAGRPLILHSLETFRSVCDELLLAASEADLEYVRDLLPGLRVVVGGATRHGSETNALAALRDLGQAPTDSVVAIHDAARPLVTASDVEAVFGEAERCGAAMLAEPSQLPALEAETVVTRAYRADSLWRAQTPQAAQLDWLLDAYGRAAIDDFEGTDTAAALVWAGYAVRVVPASAENPKITVPEDLPRAEELLARRMLERAAAQGKGR